MFPRATDEREINEGKIKILNNHTMISKIEKIQSVGVYDQYQAQGDISFKGYTYIYAENGSGKTTLSSILRSLSQNNPDAILKRKRIDSILPQNIEIKESTNNSPLVFRNCMWNRPLESIVVFDSFFVNENVYAGFDFNVDQRKRLYQFVIGTEGVKIAKLITRIKSKISDINSQILTQEQLLKADTNDLIPINEFIDIVEDDGISQKVQDKERELQKAKNQDTIRLHAAIGTIPEINVSLNFEEIGSILNQSVEGIGKDYISIVEKQIKKLEGRGMSSSQAWLQKGHRVIKENQCPFCNQSIQELDLIKGYNQYFNEQYTLLSEKVDAICNDADALNVLSLTKDIQSAYQQFKDNYSFWKTYLLDLEPYNEISIDTDEFVRLVEDLKRLLHDKRSNCTQIVTGNSHANLQEFIEKVNANIKVLNAQIITFNSQITTMRQNLRAVEDVERELKMLQLIKKRFEPDVVDKCNLYNYLRRYVNRLNALNARKQVEQQQISQNILNNYGADINNYLNNIFGTKFTIEKTRNGGYRGRSTEPTLEYNLKFNGHVISTNAEDVNSVKYTLSEGDKNTIAFSFFLAKINADATELSNKIIVFDDPLSSLDLNRRNRTIEQIVNLKGRCEQVIVLSHNLHFLIELNNNKKISKGEKKVLKILYNASNASSSLVEYQIKQEWIDKYHHAIKDMQDYLSNPEEELKERAISGIRISLETFLKLKFCQYIRNDEGTFGQIISELESSSCGFINTDKQNVIRRLQALCEMSWRPHHGSVEEREIYTEKSVSDNELQTQYIPDALKLIKEEL